MRRPVSSLPALCAALALAVSPVGGPVWAQDAYALSLDQIRDICRSEVGKPGGPDVLECVAAQMDAQGNTAEAERARAAIPAARAREAAAEARAAEEAQAAARLSVEEVRDICREAIGKPGGPDVLACVADRLDAQGDVAEADRARAAIPEAAEREAAAARRAAEEAQAEQEARAAEIARRDAEERAAAQAAVEASRLSLEEIRDTCRDLFDKPGGPDVLGCVAERLDAQGDSAEAERARAAIPAARAREAAALERAASDTGGQGRDQVPESRIADEIAARGAPTLTPEQEAAARQAANALSGTGASAAAATGGGAGTVQEQTVTSEDVRSSAQDFDTGVVVTDDDGGLSRTQKFALGALGALAVGTLLNNRDRVVSNSGDRVVVQQDDGDLTVLKDDDALLRQAGSNVRTESFDDGSTRTIVTREDGSQVITVRDASLRVLRRVLVQTDGQEFTLIDDTADVAPVDVSTLPAAPVLSQREGSDPLREALRREAGLDRRFSLSQVRSIAEVRALAPAIEVSEVTFASGSAAIAPEQAGNLTDLAREVLASIRANPREVFLIEGHTDAVGDAAYNLALSDRRAESLALALNEYFAVPVENMVVQGYGERFLKIQTQADERANRRATVRQITQLLQTAAAD